MKPLEGIRVLDISRALAGPLCAQALGDLGAEVIKIESPGLGDETRGWPPFKMEGLSAVFLSANRTKRSVVIDLKKPQGRDVLHRMAATADVVIESFSTGVAERLGIDAKALQAINPSLIHCSISGFGREGPLRKAPGYDVILQAFTGMMSMTGDEHSGFLRSPISPIDQMTACHATTGVLAAIISRTQTGKGSEVRASLFETAMGLQRYNLQSYLETGIQPPKAGSSHESLCPYQAFVAQDGPIMIGVANDSLWRKFCQIAELDDIVDDPRFRTNADRVKHRGEVIERVQAAVARHPVNWWGDRLLEGGVPSSPINTLQQLLEHPHTQQHDILMRYEHPKAGPAAHVGQPFSLDGQARRVGKPPPLHGEHTDEVLREFGFGEEDLAILRNLEAIC